MDLDELIFEKIAKYFRHRDRKKEAAAANVVWLEAIQPRLLLMARAFTGLPVEIFPAEREGGYKDQNFFLPSRISFFSAAEENTAFYFYRIVYLSLQQSLGLNWFNESDIQPALSQQKAIESSGRVLQAMKNEYPLAYALHHRFKEQLMAQSAKQGAPPDVTWLYGKWMVNSGTLPDSSPLNNFHSSVREANQQNLQTTLRAKPVEEIKSVAIDKKQQEDYVLTHNFEKVETAEEFDGIWRDFDGDDELEKHQDALDELNMRFTVRVDDPAHSVYQAQFIENTTVGESTEQSAGKGFALYPEWNYTKQRYQPDFCKVYFDEPVSSNYSFYENTLQSHRALLMPLRKMLTSVTNKRTQQRRQPDGDEFDLDSITDLYADIHSGRTPSDKIYLSRRKIERDISISLLIDNSLSSDGYVAGNKVIDIEKQVAILFGEILNEFCVDFSVASFFSKTRNYLSYQTLKQFDQSWADGRGKIGGTNPAGYTRIGGALRHAGALLTQRPTKNKWLILLSDGKPNDYDKYEGKYGLNDVRQALRELNQNQINTYALAIEAQARYYLPMMFGQNHYQILSSTDELLRAMVVLFEKIRYQSHGV